MLDHPATELDDTQRMLRDSVAAFVARAGGPERVRAWRGQSPGFDRKRWQEMAEAGWFGLLVPEESGGLGLGFAELGVVMEELGRGLAPEPVAAGVLSTSVLINGGEAAAAETLAAVVDGRRLVLPAFQEEAAVYDLEATHTRADPVAAGFALSGTKVFVADAEGSDGFIVSAATPEGVALFLVDRDADGVRIENGGRVDHGSLATVTFESVTARHVVANPAASGAAIARAVDEARLAAAAELLGVMSQALDMTLEFVKQRVQFGKPIGSFQALQHRIVDLWTQKELARSSVGHAAQVFDRTDDAIRRGAAVSAAKSRASAAALHITREAIQLHGGMGYTDECDIGLFLKRALVLSAWLGNATYHRRRFDRLAPED